MTVDSAPNIQITQIPVSAESCCGSRDVTWEFISRCVIELRDGRRRIPEEFAFDAGSTIFLRVDLH